MTNSNLVTTDRGQLLLMMDAAERIGATAYTITYQDGQWTLTPGPLARALADQRPAVQHRCPHCGTAFSSSGPRARYCSARCRSAAYRERRKNNAETDLKNA